MTTDSPERYALSFTAGGLLAREAVVVAPIYLASKDWNQVRQLIQQDNLLQARTRTSSGRLAREVVQRLSVLTEDELLLLIEATASERAHLLWVAACRRYTLIGEFADELLRERYLLLTPTVSHAEFDGFVRQKALWHSELAELKEATYKKLRATLFRMLTEAELLSGAGEIVPAALSSRVIDKLEARIPSDVRFFPTSWSLGIGDDAD